MLDPLNNKNRPLLRILERRQRGAYVSLLIENIALSVWRPLSWCALFTGLWLLEVPQIFDVAGKVTALVVFILGLTFFFRKDLEFLKVPTAQEISRRLEQSSDLKAGHLQTLEDDLANPLHTLTRSLWDTAQKATLSLLPNLRTPAPRGVLARKDPYGFRLFSILLLITGFMVAGSAWKERLHTGVFPITPANLLSREPADINLWITPPNYTRLPQIHLVGAGHYNEVLPIAEGSKIKIRLSSIFGDKFPPVLYIDDKKVDLINYGEGQFGIETEGRAGQTMKLKQLLITRAQWDYNYMPDTPPTIKLTDSETPVVIHNGESIEFPLTVQDDYGVAELSLAIDMDPSINEKPIGHPYNETRLIMSTPQEEQRITPVYDLAWHTWSGLPVTATLSVTDHKGQIATLDPISLTLPEREFQHPVAKSLMAMRKKLAWSNGLGLIETASDLELFLSSPKLLNDNPVIFLALRTASSRLYYTQMSKFSDKIGSTFEVIKLLWDAAINIEDGNLALAMRNLRQAQKALENALQDPNSSEEEIQKLMQNFREKMAEYFIEMQRELQKRFAENQDMQNISPDMMKNMIDPQQFSELMDQLESGLLSGDKDSAREMLSRLQQMMDMLGSAKMSQSLPMDMQMMQHGVNELQQLIDKQKELLKQTQEIVKSQTSQIPSGNKRSESPEQSVFASQKEVPPDHYKDLGLTDLPPPPTNKTPENMRPSVVEEDEEIPENDNAIVTQGSAEEQKALRLILGQLMLDISEHMDDIPENLGLAEREMSGSETALFENDPLSSIPRQEKAIEHLEEAQKQLAEQFKTRMQQILVFGMSAGSGQLDPLGRPSSKDDDDGKGTDSDVKIPDEAEKKRVEEILRILRERSGDLSRPSQERDYFRRLLRQF